jgi:hypothetical protein
MSTIFAGNRLPEPVSSARTSVAGKPIAPIKWWAGVGILFLIFQIYVWGSWIMSAEFVPTPAPVGDDVVHFWIKVLEVSSALIAIGCLYYFTFRPLIRERRLTTDGAIIGVIPLLSIQDPFGIYIAPWWSYSSHFTNFGNWISQVPGAVSPNAHLVPEPITAISTMYVWLVGVPILIILATMRWWKQRYPESGAASIFFVGIFTGFIYDVIVEGAGCQVGIWAFTGAIQKWSIFGGHWNQYPLYEMVFWGGWCGLAANVMYWTNDKGQTFVERGLEKLKASPLAKGWIRYFAILGFFQVIYLCAYNIPIQFFAINGDPMPADTPAHLRGTVCGEGTSYACPGPGIPLNRVGPRADGQAGALVAPDLTVRPQVAN